MDSFSEYTLPAACGVDEPKFSELLQAERSSESHLSALDVTALPPTDSDKPQGYQSFCIIA
jgi:hypothetical protein